MTIDYSNLPSATTFELVRCSISNNNCTTKLRLASVRISLLENTLYNIWYLIDDLRPYGRISCMNTGMQMYADIMRNTRKEKKQ